MSAFIECEGRGMVVIDFTFKEMLDKLLNGELHSYCYQCGACVGDCPAAKYSKQFNPRKIMLMAVMGMKERLVCKDSIIWECTNCYNCYERCPQDVRPVEVIVALKNMITEAGLEPEEVKQIVDSVKKKGRTVDISDLVNRRRKELGLEPLKEIPIEHIRKVFLNHQEEKDK
jgi:heterodisulfide reductase subunit C